MKHLFDSFPCYTFKPSSSIATGPTQHVWSISLCPATQHSVFIFCFRSRQADFQGQRIPLLSFLPCWWVSSVPCLQRRRIFNWIRDFSFHAVRSQSRLLLDRLDLLTGGGSDSLRRKQQAASYADRAAYREQQAQATSLRQSRALVRRGRIWLD